jgi:hypothetical protein
MKVDSAVTSIKVSPAEFNDQCRGDSAVSAGEKDWM